jgi:hypothetical protein
MEGKDFGKLVATRVRSLVSLTEKGLEVDPSRVERASVPKRRGERRGGRESAEMSRKL